MKFGEYLKSQRDARGWTQPMAAEKIGIEQSYLSKLEYLSKGIVQDGESDFLYMHLQPFRPDMLAGEFADDPLLPRLEPVVRWHAQEEDRGAYYIEPAEGGRRVFEKTGDWRHVPPRLNGHLGHALALAMLLFGFGGLVVARRW